MRCCATIPTLLHARLLPTPAAIRHVQGGKGGGGGGWDGSTKCKGPFTSAGQSQTRLSIPIPMSEWCYLQYPLGTSMNGDVVVQIAGSARRLAKRIRPQLRVWPIRTKSESLYPPGCAKRLLQPLTFLDARSSARSHLPCHWPQLRLPLTFVVLHPDCGARSGLDVIIGLCESLELIGRVFIACGCLPMEIMRSGRSETRLCLPYL